ncbi:predicted protein [Lichtheimia corymbifera JMRC:FSU:9682]|uniref:Velvet domain-containing protein n=1 Tax=Lichtheimia corymbifera JMRC:FSU:9682 TaxID=1263082 RepID=A0A068S0B7_9FUNG|nr:predicted protein [Lichtheimia corymbifera JMRC:FSU:9682]
MADPSNSSYPFINISSSASTSSTHDPLQSTTQQEPSLVSFSDYGLASHITSTTTNIDNTADDITQQTPCHLSSKPYFAQHDDEHSTASSSVMAGEDCSSPLAYTDSSHHYGYTVAGYRSNSMKLKRSDRVRAMMGAVPIDMPRLFLSNPNTAMYTSRSYHLTIVEQPLQCRACGFSTSDRRPMDPVPVVQLHVYDAQGELVDPEAPENLFFILHVRLCSVDISQVYEHVLHPHLADSLQNELSRQGNMGHHQAFASSSSSSSSSSSIISPAASLPAQIAPSATIEKEEPNTPALSSVAVLVGSLVSSPSIYTDLYKHRSMYFAFPDLSVRLVGQFRLQFTLFSLGRSDKVLAESYSEPFTVYPAKLFPGMRESSELALHLNRQGLRIPVRSKERPKRKVSASNKQDY